MRRVAFCWELGGNYGHITGFVGLAQAFRARGFDVVFILRNLQFASILGDDVVCVQAPVPKFIPAPRDAYSYTGILASVGYLDASVLTDYVSSWRHLLTQLAVDLVVADHAPTCLLASRSLRLPASVIGTGFVIPPCDASFPLFTPSRADPDSSLDERVLANINRALAANGGGPLMRLGDLFRGVENYLCCFPELDHYGQRDEGNYWGPLFSASHGLEYVWPKNAGIHVFAYLTSKLKHLEQVVQAIAQLPGHKLIHIPGLTLAQQRNFNKHNISLIATPVNMETVLHKADLIISQGGMGMSSQCALAGVRHVIIPTQMEQTLLAKRLASLGMVYALSCEAGIDEYFELFNKALCCEFLGRNIQLLARKYAGFSQSEQLNALAEDIAELLLP